MDTIGASTITFDSVAKLVSALDRLGVGERHISLAAASPGRARELAELLQAKLPVPRRLFPAECEQLIAHLLPAKIDEEGNSKARVMFAIFTDERERLTTATTVRWLLSHLTGEELYIVLRLSGLDGDEVLTAAELAVVSGLSPNQVKRRRTRANAVMRAAAIQLVENWREAAQ